MKAPPPDFRIGPYTVRPARDLVEGPSGSEHVEPRLIRLLVCLTDRAGQVVEREELIGEVWNGRFVTDNSLNNAIAELRRILGETAASPRWIQTVRGTGYRFMAEVEPVEPWRPRPPAARYVYLAALIGVALWIAWWRSESPPRAESSERVQRVSSGPGVELDPAISQSGTRIAYAAFKDDRATPDLFVYDTPDSTTRRLTDSDAAELSPVWSPNGDNLLFIRLGSEGCQLARIGLQGGAASTMAEIPCSSRWLATSPDGTTLAISGSADDDLPIRWFRVEGEKAVELGPGQPATVLGYRPSFSPDGGQLAYQRRVGGPSRLVRIEVVGLDEAAPPRTVMVSAGGLDHTWAEPGLIVAGWYGDRQGVWLASLDGRSPVQLEATLPGASGVSAGLGGLAITQWAVRSRLRLRSLGPGGETARELFPSSDVDTDPALSPDGRSLVFVSGRSGAPNLWLGDLESGVLQRLTKGESVLVGRPRWSPDGQRIVYEAIRKGQSDIVVLEMFDIESPATIASSPAEEVAPSWSQDGRSILFVSNRQGPWALWRADFDGGAPTRLRVGEFTSVHELAPDRFLVTLAGETGLWIVEASESPARLWVATATPISPQDLVVESSFAYWLETDLTRGKLELRRKDIQGLQGSEAVVLDSWPRPTNDPLSVWGLAAGSSDDGPIFVVPELVSRTSDIYLLESATLRQQPARSSIGGR